MTTNKARRPLVTDTPEYQSLVKIGTGYGNTETAITTAHALMQFCKDNGIDFSKVQSDARTRFLSDPSNQLKVRL